MEYIKPKEKGVKVDWSLSRQVLSLISQYSLYARCSEEEVVEQWMLRLKDDEDFRHWLLKRRRNKRALANIYGIEPPGDDESSGKSKTTRARKRQDSKDNLSSR